SSSNNPVASVDSSGRVTGNSEGNAIVYAEAYDEDSDIHYAAEFDITVAQEEKISEKERYSVDIDVDEAVRLGDIMNTDITDPTYFEWSSDDTSVVKVSSNGVATGLKTGTATVTAFFNIGSVGYTHVFEVTVNKPAQAVETTKDISMNIDDSIDLFSKYIGTGSSRDNYSWYSDNSAIVNVNSSGVITANKSGNTTVYGTADTISGKTVYNYKFNITVNETTKKKNISVAVDDTKDLYSYVNDDYSASSYDWSSDDKKYVTVNSKGVITGEKKGSATVTATYKDLKYVFDVTVTSSSSSSSSSDRKASSSSTAWTVYVPENDSVNVSDLLEYSASDYTWSSDDTDIASVKSKGSIKGVDEGSTKVYAKKSSTNYVFTVKVSNKYEHYDTTLYTNESYNLAQKLDREASNYDFSSDRTSIVTVTNKGIITGKNTGIATVTATYGKYVTQFFITVKKGTTTETTTQAAANLPAVVTEKPVEVTTAAPAPTYISNQFPDISHRAWAIDAINNMVKMGYLVGREDSKFYPDEYTRRCDCTIVLIKMASLTGKPASNYADVEDIAYFADYVGMAKQYGIESGVSENSFRPFDNITREEMMVMTYKVLQHKGVAMNTDTSVLNNYEDNSWIADNNREAVAALIDLGVISGTSATKLEPSSPLTRAQMAVILNNVVPYTSK
ncbi:MAG: Ig-like domain-containing protein, partial [Firmicutes bacterium]|nr:Ig-like domain-containing protein [Bacillota bacterium]